MGWADLHHTYGNQAVLRTLRSRLTPGAVGGLSRRQAIIQNQGVSPRLQTKLTVNTPGDQYEQEADRVAEQVMRMPAPNPPGSPATASAAPVLQRECACGGSGGGSGQCPECAKKELQRSAFGPAATHEVPPVVDVVVREPGLPLDTSTRAFFESRFGEDFTHVRLHHDALANRAAASVDALAFAVGNHVAFAEGAYSPATKSGRRLLAHELIHVLQQRPTDDGSANPLGQGKLGQAPVGPVKLQRQSPPGPSPARKDLLPGSLGEFDEYDQRRFRESVLDGQGLTGNRENDTAVLAERFLCDRFPWTDFDHDPLFCLDSAVTRGRPVFSKYKSAVIEPEYDKTKRCIAPPAAGSNTFFGKPIPPQSSKTLRSKLLEAEARAKFTMCLNGQVPFHLDRDITTYPDHSPGEDKAVDIDVEGQPYIMHETQWVPKLDAHGNKVMEDVVKDGKVVTDKAGNVVKKVVKIPVPETEIDDEVRKVYHRIAFWAHYRQSIIPEGITSVSVPPGGSTMERRWKNPNTAQTESISTGQLYELLQQESTGMKDYFRLLVLPEQDLTIAVDAFNALILDVDKSATATKRELPTDTSAPSIGAFKRRIADDYRLVGGSPEQLKDFAGALIANASLDPAPLPRDQRSGDRPFEKGSPAGSGGATQNRRPELGFITLPKEIVVALTEVGLTWGAIDFGGSSGDVMHFDCRKISGC
jgi:hypothetical protein